MDDLLTIKEIRVFYDHLLTKPGYINVIRKSLNEIKIEQILDYATQVHNKAVLGLYQYSISTEEVFHDDSFPFPRYPFDAISSKKPDAKFPDGSKLGDYTNKLKYWLRTSKSVIKLLDHEPEERVKKRTLSDIAIQYYWEGKLIDRKNKDEFAELWPDLKLKNGNKLYQKFTHYTHKTNRVNDLDNDKSNITHLEHLRAALKYLEQASHIETAENEIDTFIKNVKDVSGQIL